MDGTEVQQTAGPTTSGSSTCPSSSSISTIATTSSVDSVDDQENNENAVLSKALVNRAITSFRKTYGERWTPKDILKGEKKASAFREDYLTAIRGILTAEVQRSEVLLGQWQALYRFHEKVKDTKYYLIQFAEPVDPRIVAELSPVGTYRALSSWHNRRITNKAAKRRYVKRNPDKWKQRKRNSAPVNEDPSNTVPQVTSSPLQPVGSTSDSSGTNGKNKQSVLVK